MQIWHRMSNRRVFAAGLCISMALTGGILMTDPALADVQRLRPIIALSCPPADSDLRQALCGALKEALQEAAPQAVIRRTQARQDAPVPQGSLEIDLLLERETPHGMAARLRWKTDPQSAWVTGPDVALDSVDVALRPSMMKQLAQGLLKINKLPLPAS